jgi:type II secretory pathway pseudopilin PulG
MAVRKTSTRRTVKKRPLKSAKGAGNRMPVSVAFRIFVLIVIIIAFFMLLPLIKNLRQNAKATETEQVTDETREKIEDRKKEDERKPKEEVTGNREQVSEGKKPQTKKSAEQTTVKPQTQPENKPQPEKSTPPALPPTATTQPSTPPAQPPAPPAPVSAPPVKPAETRGSVYLISNGILVKVNRNLNANTPLTDSINALLVGPTPDEIMRGIESFVPEGSKLLSVRVDGITAYLDFNQEFRYNTRGSEGCAAQIKQIVWTATEFPNIQNVLFLIEGKKVDFLSEGVVISNPIGR